MLGNPILGSQRVEGMSMVYTIGYEGADIDRFVATLRAVGVTMLADVRAIALSRKKGFSKNGLRDRLEAEGITYVHLVELGDPKLGRDAARAGKYSEFRRIYSVHLKTADAVGALDVLDEMARQGAVCLLCFERDPATCHRTLIADRLKARGLEVFDLYGDGPNRYVRHAKKVPRRHHHQGDAESQPEAW
jgi:uncharacterized protein (DUF488 family)